MNKKTTNYIKLVFWLVMGGLLLWAIYDFTEGNKVNSMSCEELWLYGQEVSKGWNTSTRHAHIVAHYITDCTNG